MSARNGGPDPCAVALDLAREVGALLLEHLEIPREIAEKTRRADLVTDADRASEALILARLRSDFPHATILTEESGLHRGVSDERWIIDPLDGTTNFAHGYPLFCVSIAYERAGELICGVVNAPALGECFVAQRGSGAQCNGERIAISSIPAVGEGLLCTGFHPADYARNAAHFAIISEYAQGVRRDGSAALDLAYVACGRFDAFWEWDLQPWDVAAGTLLVREAGGRVSAIDGGIMQLDGRAILASNGAVHDELMGILARAR